MELIMLEVFMFEGWVFGTLLISLMLALDIISGDCFFKRVFEVYDIFLTNLLNIVDSKGK